MSTHKPKPKPKPKDKREPTRKGQAGAYAMASNHVAPGRSTLMHTPCMPLRSASADPSMPPPVPMPEGTVSRRVVLLLNLAHAIDHMFLLIFATAVGTIAVEFGFSRWEDLMPYGVGAFVFFGLGSLPAGRLGDLWGRRRMMLVFFFGIGVSALLAALTRNAWQMAAALTLLGAFASSGSVDSGW